VSTLAPGQDVVDVPLSIEREVSRLLFDQAAALDDRRWDAFLALFVPEGRYWAPGSPEQTHWDGVASIFCEDLDLMQVRKARLEHPRAWSMAAEWETSHIISNIRVMNWSEADNALEVHSRFSILDRRRETFRTLAGRYVHHLRMTDRGFRIELQRVDLVGVDSAFQYVLQAWL
jgi:3-phenylpropionate/cinnamic acid dioxygenase small subunit